MVNREQYHKAQETCIMYENQFKSRKDLVKLSWNHLSHRSLTTLWRLGFIYIGELRKYVDKNGTDEFLKVRNFGVRSAAEIEVFLETY